MSNEITFKNVEDLYIRILPALKSKIREVNNMGYNYIHEEDLWNYLKNNIWIKARDLDLSTIVNDIFNVSVKDLSNYVINIIKNDHRKIEEEI